MWNRDSWVFAFFFSASAVFSGCGDDDTDLRDDAGGDARTIDVGAGDVGTEDVESLPDASAPDAFEPDLGALEDARNRRLELRAMECACDSSPFGTTEECEAFDPIPSEYLVCEASAYADHFAEVLPSQVCESEQLADYVSCGDAVDCDEAATTECFRAWVTASGDCPRPPDAYYDAQERCIAATITGDPSTCPSETLTSVGAAVARGSTPLQGSDFELSCNIGGSPDVALAWVAPSAGTFRIDTVGSAYNTTLAVFDACEGVEQACSDDGGPGLWSEVTIEVDEGQTIIIVVSGFREITAGSYVLNINEVVAS